jgi:transposase, IS5 family
MQAFRAKTIKNLHIFDMKPKRSPIKEQQQDLFRVELSRIIDPNHAMVKIANSVDWDRMDELFGETYCPDNGRPGVSTRLMVSLHYLKYTFNLSDDDTVAGWVENPYWQHLSGMKFFQHKSPIHSSSMTRWRKRIGEAGAEELLKETISAGLKTKAVKTSQLKRVNVDTTVQEKEIRFPTDARLYDRARQRLVAAAKEREIPLRQNYNRNAKKLILKQSRYAHARQMKRAAKCTSKLKTYLGRVIRDIQRKQPLPDKKLSDLLDVATRIHQRTRKEKNKIYSVHAPEVECISKGKAHKRYEFGCKVSVAATSRGGWFVGAMAIHGNPYDGHTLSDTLSQVKRVAKEPLKVFVDRGYRGHDYKGDIEVHVDKVRRGKTARSLWRWMKRRAAVEPGIGHLKREHRMDRNRLKGTEGDKVNAILSAAGMNFRKLLRRAALLFGIIFSKIIEAIRPKIWACWSPI